MRKSFTLMVLEFVRYRSMTDLAKSDTYKDEEIFKQNVSWEKNYL
jgi:hypothetical protein